MEAKTIKKRKILSFELKNDLSELETLSRLVENFGFSTGLSRKCVFEINLGLDELFTNIISYGFKDNLEHLIKIQMKRDNGTMTVCVEDDGLAFNPIEAKESNISHDIDKFKIGGLGIHIAKKLMDNICYERCDGKNKLTLKKTIEKN